LLQNPIQQRSRGDFCNTILPEADSTADIR
jgi:hypothetical protein